MESENSVGRARVWKWGKEGACEAFRKAICSFVSCEGVGPLEQLTQLLLVEQRALLGKSTAYGVSTPGSSEVLTGTRDQV